MPTFFRSELYPLARRQLTVILLLAVLLHVSIDWALGPFLAAFCTGLLIGDTIVGGGLFTIVHTLGHVGRTFQSALIREGAAGHAEHHLNPQAAESVRMNDAMAKVVAMLHLVLIAPMPVFAWFGPPALAFGTFGIVLGSRIWFWRQEEGHLLSHTDPVLLTPIEAFLVRHLESRFHLGHHQPEDAGREERAPLALYHFQLWPEWVCGSRFYRFLDAFVSWWEPSWLEPDDPQT